MKKYEIGSFGQKFIFECDDFDFYDHILRIIKDATFIAAFKDWDYVMEINDETRL